MKSDARFAAWIGGIVVLFLVVATRASAPAEDQPASVATRALLARGDAARGAALAADCNHCHGANGITDDPAFPNLAGQSVAVLYKQLEDFKSGRRDPDVMGFFVAELSQQQLLDLATLFASHPKPYAATPTMPASAAAAAAWNLIDAGSPSRGIAPCATCHGPSGLVDGAPELRGQQRAYLEEQLQAFRAGSRHNDVGAQMRSVARQLTDEEIAVLAAYYASFASRGR